jgi:SRSO17 transposase
MRHRKPGPPVWLLIHRELGEKPEVKHYISNADAETPLSTLALVACTRFRVEEFFEDGKSYLGMAQFETRSWVGWHHHMTLVGLAHLFVTLTRRRLQKEAPELKLPLAIALVDYHVRRNKVAKESHAKTWRAKHRGLRFLRL